MHIIVSVQHLCIKHFHFLKGKNIFEKCCIHKCFTKATIWLNGRSMILCLISYVQLRCSTRFYNFSPFNRINYFRKNVLYTYIALKWQYFVSLVTLFFLFQSQMFTIVHNLLVNSDTRDTTLNYISQVIERNSKRSQIQVMQLW